MRFTDYLSKNEPIALKVLSGAFSGGRVPHAFLLAGEPGLPLKEAAYFIAESLVCEHPSPLADESCRNCERIRKGNYADFLFLDGSVSSIKKEDVQAVLGDFSRTPVEARGVMVYVIHLVENMTPEAVNSLLKFLEEPPSGCYAILTSENVGRVLPTIVSRSETIRFIKAPYEEVVHEAVSLGVEAKDACLLALSLNSGELVKEEAESEAWPERKKLYEEAMGDFAREKDEGLYRFEKIVVPAFAKKEDARALLLVLSSLLRDALLAKEGVAPRLSAYATMINAIGRERKHLSASLQKALEARSELDLNMAPALVLSCLARAVYED